MEAHQERLSTSVIHAVFFGGGTPSSLAPHNARRLLKSVRDNFNLANDYELTLEGRIHDLVPEKIEAWMEGGVNRVSLGVQSFDTKVRQQLLRIDSKEEVLRRLELLRKTQQCSVVVDLIYGLPDQTMAVWEEDLRLLTEAQVDGMDLYQLNVFADSDLAKAVEGRKISAPATTPEQAEMYAFAHDYIGRRPYTRLSSCHWKRDNRERSLYNTLVKQGFNIYPFGCGAGGTVDGYKTMLHRTIGVYEAMLEQGKKPLMFLLHQSPSQPAVDLILGQIEQGYLDLASFAAYNSLLQELKYLFAVWEERGLLSYNGVLYRLTIAGQFWQVNLAQSVLECVEYLLFNKFTTAQAPVAAQDTLKRAGMQRG